MKPYNPKDTYMRKAKKEGYRARSVYKLMELDQRFHLFKPGMNILDIGAAPGSWLQYVAEKIGSDGHALGLDLQQIQPIAKNITTEICDVLNDDQLNQCFTSIGWKNADVVISDIAPNTSGIAHSDHARSIELNEHIAAIANRYLKSNGILIMKVFPGVLFAKFINDLKKDFYTIHQIRVQATRDRSNEVYVVAKKKPNRIEN